MNYNDLFHVCNNHNVACLVLDFLDAMEQIINNHDIDYRYGYVEETVECFNEKARNNNMTVRFNNGACRAVILTETMVFKVEYDSTVAGGNYDEVRFYKSALKHGYGYLFAESTLVDICGFCDIEMQERVYQSRGNRGCQIHNYTTYAEDEFLANHVKDLHNANWCFDAQGNVKIFDYAANKYSFPFFFPNTQITF